MKSTSAQLCKQQVALYFFRSSTSLQSLYLGILCQSKKAIHVTSISCSYNEAFSLLID